MKFTRIAALATLMLLTLGSGALVQEARAQEADPTATTPSVKSEKFKDWDMFCPEPKAGAPHLCELRTVVMSKDGKRMGALVVASVVDAGGGQVIASALVPLGVDLTAQPTLVVGESQKIELKYLRCLQRGCEAVAPLSDSQQAALRAGTVAKVALGIGGEKTVTLEFSLSGFSAAHDALKKRIAAH